jgi:hypothetical protein
MENEKDGTAAVKSEGGATEGQGHEVHELGDAENGRRKVDKRARSSGNRSWANLEDAGQEMGNKYRRARRKSV